MDTLACCFFPTVTVLVDDQRSFLSKIELNLQEVTALRSYDDPFAALEDLNQHHHSRLQLDKIIHNTEELSPAFLKPDQHAFTVDVPAILKHLYDPKRFLEVSDLLVDYNMPSLNGVELCQKIQNKAIRKLLITGDADTSIAIDAFNNGIISKFIPKQTEQLTQTIIDCIQSEKQAYFAKCSATLMNMLMPDAYNCFQHPAFHDCFQQICREHHIVEYYLIDDSGSYLLLDKFGKPTWFIVRSEQALEDNLVYAEDSKAPKGIQDVLRNREKCVFLFSEKDQLLPAIQWLPYLHDIQPMKHVEGFYYTVIQNAPVYDNQLKPIFSYEAFLTEAMEQAAA